MRIQIEKRLVLAIWDESCDKILLANLICRYGGAEVIVDELPVLFPEMLLNNLEYV
jgi:hypothetical protein